MPRLQHPAVAPAARPIEFVTAVSLDLLNAMYFTFLARDYEGVGAWPVETWRRLDPSLRQEMEALFTYPRGEPGIMGALTDTSILHPRIWHSVDALLEHVRALPADGVRDPKALSIRGLARWALRWPCDEQRMDDVGPPPALSDRAFRQALAGGDQDVDAAMDLYGRPEDVRARMLSLIRRFYDEHYRPDEARRMAIMRRCAEARTALVGPESDAEAVTFRIARREILCLKSAPEPYTKFVFLPSVDVGAYVSCADVPPVHGIYFSCDALTAEASAEGETARLALVHKALADEQRLRILQLLRERGELYAQEIVEATGLSQPVVSRHLSFMKAVGLVTPRRQGNMKYFTINDEMRGELARTLELFAPARRREDSP